MCDRQAGTEKPSEIGRLTDNGGVTMVPRVLLIIGVGVAAITVGGGLFWWRFMKVDQPAEDNARSACAALVREAGGDPSTLCPAEVLEAIR